MVSFNITPATKSDLDNIYALAKKEFPYLVSDPEKFQSRYKGKQHLLLVAFSENEFAGFIEAEFLNPLTVRINGIAVISKFRGKGCARQLMEHMISSLTEMKIQEILLLVKQQNAVAKSLYSKFGFSFSEKLNRKIDNGVIDIFKLDITPACPIPYAG